MAKLTRSKIVIIILVAIVVIAILNRAFSTPLEISNIRIEPIDKNTVNITWNTNKEANGWVDIDDPTKVSEILRNAFSCNVEGDLTIETSEEDTFKKYGCTYSKDNGVSNLVHNGVIYYGCWRDSRYFLCKGSKYPNSKQHSVIINVLQPNTEYTFKIGVKVEPPTGWPKEFAEKDVTFKMP